jgi:hypothetical protein
MEQMGGALACENVGENARDGVRDGNGFRVTITPHLA